MTKYTPGTAANTTSPPRDFDITTVQKISRTPSVAPTIHSALRLRIAKAIRKASPPMQIVIDSSLGSWSSPRYRTRSSIE